MENLEDIDCQEQPINYSLKYSINVEVRDPILPDVITVCDSYDETDPDQIVDYSQKYQEHDGSDENNLLRLLRPTACRNRFPKVPKTEEDSKLSSNYEDTVKVYCTEGTPVNFSLSSSLTDLRDVSSVSSLSQTSNRKCSSQNADVALGGCTSRAGAAKKASYMPTVDELGTENGKISGELVNNKHTPAKVKSGKSPKYEEEIFETPLMFSRSSSLTSLSSFEQPLIHDDRSSVSDVSCFSGVVSPSDLPDSPGQTMPPSPVHKKRSPVFEKEKPFPGKTGVSSETLENLKCYPGGVFDDTQKSFGVEGTPVNFSTTSSLSSLSIENELGHTRASLFRNVSSSETSNESKVTVLNTSPNSCDEGGDHEKDNENSSDSSYNEDDEELLLQCIQAGLPKGKSESSPVHLTQPFEHTALVKEEIYPSPRIHSPRHEPSEETSDESCDDDDKELLFECIKAGLPKGKCEIPDRHNQQSPEGLGTIKSSPPQTRCSQGATQNKSDPESGCSSDEELLLECVQPSVPDSAVSECIGKVEELSIDVPEQKNESCVPADSVICSMNNSYTPPRNSCASSDNSCDEDGEQLLLECIQAGLPKKHFVKCSDPEKCITQQDLFTNESNMNKPHLLKTVSEEVGTYKIQTSVSSCDINDSGAEASLSCIQSTECTEEVETVLGAGELSSSSSYPLCKGEICRDESCELVIENSPLCKADGERSISDSKISVDEGFLEKSNCPLVEGTPVCFSQNSPLSSLSISSDEDEISPNEKALLEECIRLGMPKEKDAVKHTSQNVENEQKNILSSKDRPKSSSKCNSEVNSESSCNEDDEKLLMECIEAGLPKKKSHSSGDEMRLNASRPHAQTAGNIVKNPSSHKGLVKTAVCSMKASDREPLKFPQVTGPRNKSKEHSRRAQQFAALPDAQHTTKESYRTRANSKKVLPLDAGCSFFYVPKMDRVFPGRREMPGRSMDTGYATGGATSYSHNHFHNSTTNASDDEILPEEKALLEECIMLGMPKGKETGKTQHFSVMNGGVSTSKENCRSHVNAKRVLPPDRGCSFFYMPKMDRVFPSRRDQTGRSIDVSYASGGATAYSQTHSHSATANPSDDEILPEEEALLEECIRLGMPKGGEAVHSAHSHNRPSGSRKKMNYFSQASGYESSFHKDFVRSHGSNNCNYKNSNILLQCFQSSSPARRPKENYALPQCCHESTGSRKAWCSASPYRDPYGHTTHNHASGSQRMAQGHNRKNCERNLKPETPMAKPAATAALAENECLVEKASPETHFQWAVPKIKDICRNNFLWFKGKSQAKPNNYPAVNNELPHNKEMHVLSNAGQSFSHVDGLSRKHSPAKVSKKYFHHH